jgi:hypothetical protein
MNKIILADSQAIFRAGTAKVLAMDEDLRIIAQCADLDRMHHAITTFPGPIQVSRLKTIPRDCHFPPIVAEETKTDAERRVAIFRFCGR